MRYVLQRKNILNNESQALRSESQKLRDESQKERNELKELRNEAQAHRSESLTCKNKPQIPRSKSWILRNKSKILRSEPYILRNKSQILRSESWILRNKSLILRNAGQALRNKSLLVRTESKELRSKPQILRNESKELRNEAQALRSNHHRVYTEELNKIEINSNNDKRIETFDKVTTYPYGANVFKVCEGEMSSKNKLIEPDEDIDNTKTEDIDNTKTEDIDNIKTKDKCTNKRRNKRIQMFMIIKRWINNNGNWKKKRRIVWAFWDDDHISELCEKWVYYDGNYAYTRFEELRKRSGEVRFTREYKTTTSKDNSNVYIDIDKLQIIKDFSIRDKTTAKTKEMLDKINNKKA